MKNGLILFLFVISLQAFAGDHNIDFGGRSDWKLKNNDIDKTQDPNSSSFEINYLLTSFSGKLSPSYTYFISTDLLQSNTGSDVTNGTSAFIYEAYITKSFGEDMSVSIGKKTVLIGGREYDYFPYDLYTTSYIYNSAPDNELGVTLTKQVGEQLWMFQLFNGNKNNVTSKPLSNTQSKFGYSLGWYGNFLDKFIKPIVAYTVVPKGAGGARTSKGDDVYIGGGVQFNTPHNFVLEADYGMLTENHFGGDGVHQKTKSIVGLIRYTGENYMPFFKMISDVITLDSAEKGKRSAFDVGVEYKPSNEDPVSYHIVYSGESIKSNVDSSPTSITVGLKFDASLLK